MVHLACLLGKHKALEVLSEFGFHPLSHAAITDETPLHMAVRLLRHEWSGSIFLCDVVVSIVKTLNRHIRGMFLLLAEDNKGNTVLHSMAEIIGSPSTPEAVALLFVYLFRVFVHLLLKEEFAPLQLWSLSISLTYCNQAGQNVEFLLKRNSYGKQLLKYLRDVSGMKEVTVTSTPEQVFTNATESHGQTATVGKSNPFTSDNIPLRKKNLQHNKSN